MTIGCKARDKTKTIKMPMVPALFRWMRTASTITILPPAVDLLGKQGLMLSHESKNGNTTHQKIPDLLVANSHEHEGTCDNWMFC